MIIAIDFDGTLVEDQFPEIGPRVVFAFEALKGFKEQGNELILWTCRKDSEKRKYLTEAIEFCRAQGIEFDAINENHPASPYAKMGNSRKIFADFYIDDRSLQPNWSEYYK